MSDFQIRVADIDDAEEILDIYAWYVIHTAISFEDEVPSLEEFRGRMKRTLQRYPYLVAVEDGRIAGYAYAGPFVGRAAYDWSAEMTIYLAHDRRGCGIGGKLYRALEEALRRMGVRNLYACIGYPQEDDEYLTKNSAQFHAHLGYRQVGLFTKCGHKFGRWYDMIWMEKIIGEHPDDIAPIRPYKEIRKS